MKEERRLLLILGKMLLLTSAYAACILNKQQKSQKRYRRYAVRPMNRNRHENGHFFSLTRDMMTLEWDREQFCKYTRCTPGLFNKLLQLVGPKLQKDIRKNPCVLSPAHRVTLTLHYLAEGCSMQEVARNFRVGKTTAQVVIKETCRILWDVLQPIVLEKPDTDKLKTTANEYFKRWNMPNCVGAVDGKHVMIRAPSYSGSEYFNYKKSFSIVLMAVCDAYYRFIFVDVGAPGSNHDGTVFKNSEFGRALLSGNLGIPEPTNLPHTSTKFNHFLVADQAFPLHNHIMRPYPGQDLGDKKNIFNYRLSRARRTIENAFGILVQRWRILRKEIVAEKETCEEIVRASVVLHNFLQKGEDDLHPSERRYVQTGLQESVDENGLLHADLRNSTSFTLHSIGRTGSNNAMNSAKEARDGLAEYFVSEVGSLPWQEEYVRRGSLP